MRVERQVDLTWRKRDYIIVALGSLCMLILGLPVLISMVVICVELLTVLILGTGLMLALRFPH
jgi:hypothetical protein